MNKILVPTDFSDCANNAFKNALVIAEKSGAELHLIHGIQTTLDWTKLSDEQKANRPEIVERIEHAEEQFQKIVSNHPKISIQTHVVPGLNPSQVVLNYISKHEVDLVMLGSHGKNDSEHFIGSTAQKIQRGSDAPVVLIKLNQSINSCKLIVFASNFEEEMKKPFEKLLKVANSLDALIQLVYINTPSHFKDSDYSENLMEKFISQFPNEGLSSNIYNAQYVDKGVIAYGKKVHADFIALTTHGKRNVPSYLMGVTEMVSFHSDIPIISINLK